MTPYATASTPVFPEGDRYPRVAFHDRQIIKHFADIVRAADTFHHITEEVLVLRLV
jgi:hypothetical protein